MLEMIKQFFSNKDGNIAMTAGLTFPVVVAMSMATLDYGTVLNRQQALKNAANTAALSAVNEAMISYKNLEEVDLEEMIAQVAEQTFVATASNIQNIGQTSITANAKVVKNTLSVEVEYSATYETIFGQFVGKDTIAVTGDASATASATSYINFTYLIDVSASMGIGATTDDMTLVQQAAGGCAFACHLNTSPNPQTTYDDARALGANMRIDVAREAAINTLDIIKENTEKPNQYTVGVYAFDSEFITVSDISDPNASDTDYVANKIRDSVFMQESGGGTNIDWALSNLANVIPEGGSGRASDDRRQILIVMTDGVQGTFNFYGGGNKNSYKDRNAIINWPRLSLNSGRQIIYGTNSNACDALREKGVEVFFLQVEYLIPPGYVQPWSNVGRAYRLITRDLQPRMDARFTNCTGDADFVFKASTPAEIEAAFNEVLSETTAPLHLN